MTRIFQLTLTIFTFWYMQQMHAAAKPKDLVARFPDGAYQWITQMLQQPERIEEVILNFNEHADIDRNAHMCSLFRIFGKTRQSEFERIGAVVGSTWTATCNLLHVASEFKVAQNKNVRDAFFYIPDGHTPVRSMLYPALLLSSYPLEKLVEWFPQDDLRSDYMLYFLNECPHDVSNNEDFKNRVLHVCGHIGFDAWESLKPNMQQLLLGTIGEKTVCSEQY